MDPRTNSILEMICDDRFQIFFHEKMEDIFKHFPKEIIPKDYGGEEKSMEELNGAQ